MLTLVFAVYALSLLLALLTTGALSDHLGRKPVILAALVLEIVSLAVFARAGDVQALVLARVLQGFATGMASAAKPRAIKPRIIESTFFVNGVNGASVDREHRFVEVLGQRGVAVHGQSDVFTGGREFQRQHGLGEQLRHVWPHHVDAENAVGLGIGNNFRHTFSLVRSHRAANGHKWEGAHIVIVTVCHNLLRGFTYRRNLWGGVDN